MNITQPPREDIVEGHLWRDWFMSITAFSKSPYNRIPQFTTANAPSYAKGALYFDLTLNKLRVGGATAWETITSI